MPPRIQSLRWRRFVAKYVTYLEIFAYGMVLVVGGGLIVAWTYKVDVVADSKEGDLKPYEHEINAAKDCLVVRLPVANKTDVRKGDVVARVCAEPDWIKRYQAMAEVRTALEQMQAMAASVTATSQERAVMESLAGGLAVWDAAAEPTLEPIVAPADGTLWLGSCTTGTRVAADKKLCVVKDFNILRAKLAFETSNAFACRPGLPGWVEVNTEQKDETLVRLNTDTLPYVPYFGSRLGLFSSIAADDIRSAVTKDLKGKGLLDRDRANTNDFPLPADSFAGITVFVDGRPEDMRRDIWAAADIFTSLSDNVQETFGLTPIEAKAAGLPVVISDWNGYRDTVRPDVDGFAVPTWMPPPGVGGEIAYYHGSGFAGYEAFTAATSQSIAVDVEACRKAFQRLVEDADLRRRMGDAGRLHARQTYDWCHVVAAYQDLWGELAEVRASADEIMPPAGDRPAHPLRADPFVLFKEYPTALLTPESRLSAAPGADAGRVRALRASEIASPLPALLLSEAETVAILEGVTARPGALGQLLRATPAAKHVPLYLTVGWLAKMGLLVLSPGDGGAGEAPEFGASETWRNLSSV